MKCASIYKLGESGYLLHAQNKAKSGFWIACDPYIGMPENAAAGDLVHAIRSCLVKDDGERVRDPKDWEIFEKEMLQKMGLKSFNVLHKKNVRYCSIQVESNELAFTPSKHAEKLNQGYLHKKEKVTVPFNASDEEIASALEVAFSKCNDCDPVNSGS